MAKYNIWQIVGKIYKNFWTRQAIGLTSIWYIWFLFGIARDFYTHIVFFENPVSLFALYLLVNLIFGLMMFYSRSSIITQVCSFFFHPFILAVFITTNFSNLWIIIPPLVVSTFILIFSRSNESFKVVVGSMYVVLFVVAVVGFKLLDIFKISVFPYNYELRDNNYTLSKDGKHRIVKYIDPIGAKNRTATYYVEDATKDFEKNFMKGIYTYKAIKLNTLRYNASSPPEVYWISNTVVYIDGGKRDITKDGRLEDETYNPLENQKTTTFNNETNLMDEQTPPTITVDVTVQNVSE